MERLNKSETLTAKVTYFNTDCSPSHLFNNLTTTDKSLLFIHNSEVQPRIITVDHKLFSEEISDKISTYVSKFNSNETNEMLTIKCLYLNSVFYLAVGLYGGFKLWSSDGNRLLFQIPAKVKDAEKPYAFSSICEFASQEGKPADAILCGDNFGQLFLVVGYGQIWRSKLIYTNENIAITSITAKNEIVSIAYENGEIHLIKIKGDFLNGSPTKIINPLKLPSLTTSIISLESKSILVAGYLNGEVKLFDLNNGNLLSSVNAHLRMINSLQTYRNYLITLGDDCQCNIFKITSEEGEIKLVSNFELPDRMPVGLVIITKSNFFDLVISIYDSTELALVNLISNIILI